MEKKFDTSILDVEDKENLIGEIDYDGRQWIEISTEDFEKPLIEFYFYEEKKDWKIPMDDFIDTLKHVMKRLIEIGKEYEERKI